MATAFVAAIACAFVPKSHSAKMVAGYSSAFSCVARNCDQSGCGRFTNGVTCTVLGATAYASQEECQDQSGTILEYHP